MKLVHRKSIQITGFILREWNLVASRYVYIFPLQQF